MSKLFCSLNFKYFVFLRSGFGLIFSLLVIERLFYLDFLVKSSLAFAKTQTLSTFHMELLNFFLSSASIYGAFLIVLLLSCLIYSCGRGGRFFILLFALLEYLFQTLSIGNQYGHEGFIHQFYLLLLATELINGQIPFSGLLTSVNWRQPFYTGLLAALFRWQLMIIYFFAALSKILSPDWHNSAAIHKLLHYPIYFFSGHSLFLPFLDWLAAPLLYFVILFQLSFFIFSNIKKTRSICFAAGIFFHLSIALLMGIYEFSFFMILLYVGFYSVGSDDQNSLSTPEISK